MDDYELLVENTRKHKAKFIWNEEKEIFVFCDRRMIIP